ncbi:MAG: hypothetical protein PHD32_00885 [Eubacteriales bacterium]|nr:hypothetical protein [Eubacteriales bacterium]
MKKQKSFYVVLGILGAALLCGIVLLIGMNRNGRIIRARSEHFSFYCYRQEVAYAKELAPKLEEVYTKAAEYLGIKSAGTISVVIHRSSQELTELTGSDAPGAAPLAVLADSKLHLCCAEQDSALQMQAVTYQMVRQMVRSVIGTNDTYLLTDAFAAFMAQGGDRASYYTGGDASNAPLPSAMTDGASSALYPDFLARGESNYACLYAAFLTDEEEGTALLKTLRGGSPCRFKRATGYEETAWDALWKQWLAQPAPYSSVS